MSLGRRLFLGDVAAAACDADTLDIFGDSSCKAFYKLDYDASDESGNYNGTNNGATFGYDGEIDYAASFDGTDDYIQADGVFSSSPSAMSASCWFKTTSDGNILEIGDNSTDSAQNRIFFASNLLYVSLNGGGGGFASTSSSGLKDGNWHHIVATWDDGSVTNGIKMYIDGASTPTAQADSTASFNSALDLFIGANDNRAASSPNNVIRQYFDGLIDHVRIFNKALSSSEVSTLYAETACTYTCTTDTVGFPSSASSNLVAYYKLDGNADDESSNNYDGTENNITYEFGRYGAAAKFTPSSDSRITHSNIFSLDDVRSVSLWAKVDSGTTGSITPYISGGKLQLVLDTTNNKIIVHKWKNTKSQFVVNSNNARKLEYSFSDFNNWHHYVMIMSGTGDDDFTLYVDGTEQAGTKSNFYTGGYTNDGDHIGTGGRYNNTYYYDFDGLIDQVRIYDKALSSDEVTELYEEKQCYITKGSSDPFGDSDEIAFYKFDNNVNDSTGSYNATNNSVTFSSSDYLLGTHSAVFSGSTSSYLGLPTGIIDSRTALSFSAFIYRESSASSYDYICSLGKSTQGKAFDLAIYGSGANEDKLYFQKGGGYVEISDATINHDQWYHVAACISGTSLQLYVDGVLVKDSTVTSFSTDSTGNVARLGQYFQGSYYWKGKIDQARFFDRALTGDEVFKLYAEVIN